MLPDKIEDIIKDYIAGVIHMSLATCSGETPWVCEVHFVYDDELNLYYRSVRPRRHSVEILRNPKVAGSIVEQHGIDQKPRGVFFEGVCVELKDVTENSLAYKLYSERFKVGPEILKEAREEFRHRFYKITVTDYYLFDARESKPSQKYHLPWGVPA